MNSLKTTIAGILSAVAVALIPVIQGHGFDWAYILPAACLAALGIISKDYNVTGGTVDNNTTPLPK